MNLPKPKAKPIDLNDLIGIDPEDGADQREQNPSTGEDTDADANLVAPRERSKSGSEARPKCGQAGHIIEKFGGVPRLVAALKAAGFEIDRTSVYKWLYTKDHGGTEGVIPTRAWPYIYRAARLNGVLIEHSDLDLRPNR